MAIAGNNIVAWGGWGGLAIATSASCDYPATGYVKSGVSYGSGAYTGTLVIPGADNVSGTVAITPGSALRNMLVADTDVYALVGYQLFPINAPEGALLPYGIYTQIDNVRERHMANASGLSRARVQIDWYDDSLDVVTDVMEKARLAVDAYKEHVVIGTKELTLVDVSIQNESADYEAVVDDSGAPIYRGTQDFYVWFNPAVTAR